MQAPGAKTSHGAVRSLSRPLGKEAPPPRVLGGQAEAEEAQEGLHQKCDSEDLGENGKERARQGRGEVAHETGPRPGPDAARGLIPRLGGGGEGKSAHEAQDAGELRNSKGGDEPGRPRPEEGDQRKGKNKGGDGEQGVGQAHEQAVGPRVEGGGSAQKSPGDDREQGGSACHRKRVGPGKSQAGKQIAPERVRAEPEAGGGRSQAPLRCERAPRPPTSREPSGRRPERGGASTGTQASRQARPATGLLPALPRPLGPPHFLPSQPGPLRSLPRSPEKRTRARPAQPRIGPSMEQVKNEIEEDDECCQRQDRPLHHRIVAGKSGSRDEPSRPRQMKDILRHDHPRPRARRAKGRRRR